MSNSSTTNRKRRAKVASVIATGLLSLGLSMATAAPASATEDQLVGCSALGADWNTISGSCVGYPSFTINWTCWGSSSVQYRVFYTTADLPGYSFNFDACGIVGVTGTWVSA